MSSANAVHRLVVVGMHRSGTSAVAGLLHAMGAHVGSDDQLTGRSAENPLGFFERRDVRNACDTLLRAGGADWWKVDAFDPAQIPPEVRKAQLNALGQIVSELDKAGVWVLKEPRISVLLPVFFEAIPDARIIHVVRNPLEVAMSLRRRNRFPLRAGAALWEAYNAAAVQALDDAGRIVVDYNALVADPAPAAAALLDALEKAGVEGLRPPDASAIARDLYRERASEEEFGGILSEAQIGFWRSLLGAGQLPSQHRRSTESRRTLREFEEDETEALKLRKRLADLQSERRATAEAAGELASVRLDALAEGVGQLRSDLASRDDTAVTSLQKLLSRAEELAQLTERQIAQGQEQSSAMSASLGSARALFAELQAREEKQAAGIATLEARLQESRASNLAQQQIAEEESRRAKEAMAEVASQAAEIARIRRALEIRDEGAVAVGRLSEQREEQWRALIAKRDMLITRLRRRLEKETLAADRLEESAAGALGQLDRVLRSRTWRGASRIAGLFGSRVLRGDANETRAGKETRKIAEARATRRNDKPPEIAPDTGRDLERFPPAIRTSQSSLGRVAFFTAIAGGYDPVSEPSVVDAAADYAMFTDEPGLTSFAWSARAFDFVHAEPARTARFVKTHPHLYFPDHDRVIWVDANLRIDCLAEDLIAAGNADCDIITWQHPIRDCVYEELAECILRRKDDPAIMRAHVEQLRAEGYPEHNGLIESSVMVVRHRRPHVIAFLNEWWKLIDNGSKRDQLSFNPALSRHPEVTVGYLGVKGVEMRTDPRFTYKHHPSYVPFKPGLQDAAE